MGTQVPLPKGAQPPIFGPYLLWPNGSMDQDATWYGVRPRPSDSPLDGDPDSPSPKGGRAPNFRPMSTVCMDQDTTWYGGRPRPRPHCARWRPSSPSPQKGAQPPISGPCLLWPNSWMDQDASRYEDRHRPRPHCVTWGPSYPF